MQDSMKITTKCPKWIGFLLIFLFLFSITNVIIILRYWSDYPNEETPLKKESYLVDIKAKFLTQSDINNTIKVLSKTDRTTVKRCGQNNKKEAVPLKRICSPKMRFRAANKSNDVTALISLPGSGNTWMRQIIEEATGIYTGSIYCDQGLKRSGFLGEQITSTSVLTIKTHVISNRQVKDTNKEYESIILLIRNPYDAIIADANRRWTRNHTNLAEIDAFRNYTNWSKLVFRSARNWAKLAETWLRRDKPLIVVKYEDLKSDLVNQMKRVLTFLKVEYSEEKLVCVNNTNQNTFKRNYQVDEENKYDYYYYRLELRQSISDVIKETNPLLEQFGVAPY